MVIQIPFASVLHFIISMLLNILKFVIFVCNSKLIQ